jgi:large subunit ribosomal protein L15
MRLHDLKPRPGARHRVKRLGCGESSGHGKTSGKGHKGQKARSGGSLRLGFEGGQMPLIRRIPKRGFNNANFTTTYAPVNLAELEALNLTEIDQAALRKAGLVNGNWDGVKILGGGDITKKFTVKCHAISESARKKIEAAGGSVELLQKIAQPARNSAKVALAASHAEKAAKRAAAPAPAPKAKASKSKK